MPDHSGELEPTRVSSPATRDAYPEERWEPGDLVIAADKGLWVRASEEDTAKGWPWGYPYESAGYPSTGAVEEGHPVRPLTLLVRRGRPVTTIRYPEQTAEPAPDADTTAVHPDPWNATEPVDLDTVDWQQMVAEALREHCNDPANCLCCKDRFFAVVLRLEPLIDHYRAKP